MRRQIGPVIAIALLTCFGCDEGKRKLAPALPKGKVAAPTSMTPTNLRLVYNGKGLRIGDSPDEVERIFSPPPDASTFKDLPPGFHSPYKSRGYETAKGVGFGVIYFEDRVALAVLREQDITPEDVQEHVDVYTTELGKPTNEITGRVAYWFWQVENQRLMICTTPDVKEPSRVDITTALGVNEAMDALRMNYQYALQDRAAAQDTLPTPVYKG